MRITVEGMGFARRFFRAPHERASAAAVRSGGEGRTLTVTVPDGTTVEGLVRRLADDYPAFGAIAYQDGRMTDGVQIVINDQLLDLAAGGARILADDDRVLVLLPFEGGVAVTRGP